jgi:hypothetical protein
MVRHLEPDLKMLMREARHDHQMGSNVSQVEDEGEAE